MIFLSLTDVFLCAMSQVMRCVNYLLMSSRRSKEKTDDEEKSRGAEKTEKFVEK